MTRRRVVIALLSLFCCCASSVEATSRRMRMKWRTHRSRPVKWYAGEGIVDDTDWNGPNGEAAAIRHFEIKAAIARNEEMRVVAPHRWYCEAFRELSGWVRTPEVIEAGVPSSVIIGGSLRESGTGTIVDALRAWGIPDTRDLQAITSFEEAAEKLNAYILLVYENERRPHTYKPWMEWGKIRF